MTQQNSSKNSKNLLDAQILFRVTQAEKNRLKKKAQSMKMSPSKLLRDYVRNAGNLQYLFSHDDLLQFTSTLGRLSGQINRMSYELNRINNNAGFFTDNTAERLEDLLNQVSAEYKEILTAIYGNIQPRKVAKTSTEKSANNSLPAYASAYSKQLAKQLASDRQKLADAIANGAEPLERRMLQNNVADSEESLHDSLEQDRRDRDARK